MNEGQDIPFLHVSQVGSLVSSHYTVREISLINKSTLLHDSVYYFVRHIWFS